LPADPFDFADGLACGFALAAFGFDADFDFARLAVDFACFAVDRFFGLAFGFALAFVFV